MKKLTLTILLTAVLILFALVSSAAAQDGQPPDGSCPDEFTRHPVHEHTDHEHHIGLTVDLNRNDYICVKHLDNGLHVHIDDVVQP